MYLDLFYFMISSFLISFFIILIFFFIYCFFFFFFKQKTAYEMLRSLVGSEMCIRDSIHIVVVVVVGGLLGGGMGRVACGGRVVYMLEDHHLAAQSMGWGYKTSTIEDPAPTTLPVSYTHLTLPTKRIV
eukprot:TRINITY_DN45774_c0_g1_i1.p1 TRINITY_DN45774_c0_g1~~TRINITY_DN45774_c0_g1_i1.p1  ORF type:complete len:129 (-),score=49.46 TRINITY_DN45774_c0_g1_i1:153-539(-)